jgi:16S rRNA processing protein RimM
MEPEHLVVGHISKPHGTKGEVFVWPLTDRPDGVFVEGRELILGDEEAQIGAELNTLKIERTRPFKRGVLVKFEGLEDRNEVEAIGNAYLLLPFDHLEPLEEGEVFYHELLGLEVVTQEGERVGRVREVYDTAPTHLLEIKSEDGKLRLIPFTRQVVREVNLETRTVVIDPPVGLLEI